MPANKSGFKKKDLLDFSKLLGFKAPFYGVGPSTNLNPGSAVLNNRLILRRTYLIWYLRSLVCLGLFIYGPYLEHGWPFQNVYVHKKVIPVAYFLNVVPDGNRQPVKFKIC